MRFAYAKRQYSEILHASALWQLSRPVEMVDEALLKRLSPRRRYFSHADRAFKQGQALSALYLIRDGLIKTLVETEEGDAQITGFHRRSDLLGLDALGAGAHMTTAVVVGAATVDELSWNRLSRMMGEDSMLRDWFVLQSSTALAEIEETLTLVGAKDGAARVATFLVVESLRRGDETPALEIALEMTRSDIAGYVGLTKESTTRLLRDLEKRGVVELQHKAIRIMNFKKLCRVARLASLSGLCQ